MSKNTKFLSCDWGTSNFRLRLIDLETLTSLAEVKNDRGIAFLNESFQDNAFSEHLKGAVSNISSQVKLNGEQIILSGMASASIGWKELPYTKCPIELKPKKFKLAKLPSLELDDKCYQVSLISGVSSDIDVMRGEEVELLGALTRKENESYLDNCIVILPGTHSKHCMIQSNKLVSFDTHMTGELYNLLRENSVLKHSLITAEQSLFKEDFFTKGVNDSLSIGISSCLFKVRSSSLLEGRGPLENQNYLSGLLIGNEMKYLLDKDTPILLSASKAVMNRYQLAAEILKLKQFKAMPNERHDYLAAEGQAQFIIEGLV